MGYDHLAVKVAVIEGSTFNVQAFKFFFKRIKQGRCITPWEFITYTTE